ncbi:MAG: UTRA domain-containing protein, partial [Actinobacteria bacterium]|nr:UTRA domain-containing protein [Actinomycetota bacterium]
GRDGAPPSSAAVLADRIAAALIHHEPGWRLPRLTALARRYNVSAAEVDAAIGELTTRHLLRRLPDGQVYRASPAEYQVPLAGLAGLSAQVDPMGGELACQSRQVSARRVPEDIGRALGLAPGATAVVVKCLWLVGGEPGALSATYLPQRLAGLAGEVGGSPLAGPDCRAVLPAAAQVELGPPPPSVTRSLRLAAGQPVAMVTVRFEEPPAGTPAALTMAMLRPDLFRIVVQALAGAEPAIDVAGFPGAWTQAAGGWEP